MYSNEDREQVKRQLDRELSRVRLPESVSERIIRSVRARKEPYWNRKIACPAPLFAALAAIVFGCAVMFVFFPMEADPLPPPSITKRIFLDSGIFVETDLPLQQNRS